MFVEPGQIEYDKPLHEVIRRQVMAAPRLVPQCRNMPLVEGRKQVPVRSEFGNSAPLYEAPPSPFLSK
jgi:hypothetical protein